MVQINFARKEINCKIVYYGPGLSGKTTNLEKVHEFAPQDSKGELTSISTDGDRTLFFDFMPLDLGSVAGMRTKFHIYTVPGQVYYNSTRKLVLLGADGVIFVADSSPGTMKTEPAIPGKLERKPPGDGKIKMPLVLQWNKRDVADAMSLEKMESELNIYKSLSFEATANSGEGVIKTLKGISGLVLESINSNERASTMMAPAGSGASAVAEDNKAPTDPEAAEETEPAAAAMSQNSDAALEAAPVAHEPNPEIERNHVPVPSEQEWDIPSPESAPREAMAPAAQRQNVETGAGAASQPDGVGMQDRAAATAVMEKPQTAASNVKPKPAAKPQRGGESAEVRKATQQNKVNEVLRDDKVREAPRPSKQPQRGYSMQVIGGKPQKVRKKGNMGGIIMAIAVIVLLAGAGVAYFLMM